VDKNAVAKDASTAPKNNQLKWIFNLKMPTKFLSNNWLKCRCLKAWTSSPFSSMAEAVTDYLMINTFIYFSLI